MTNEFVQALRSEIAALEKSLEGDPRYKKLRRLLAALEAYMDEDDIEPAPSKPDEKESRPAQPSGRGRSQRTQEIVEAAAAILKGRQEPTSSSVLLREIQARNVVVHGQRPLNNLSAILSYSGLFQSNGRAGWTLKEPSPENETADDSDLANRSSAASSEHRPTSGGTTSKPVEPELGGGT